MTGLLDAYSLLLLGSMYTEDLMKSQHKKIQGYFASFVSPLKLSGEEELSQQLRQFIVVAPSITSTTCHIFAKKLEEVLILLVNLLFLNPKKEIAWDSLLTLV